MSDILCKHGWSRRFCEPCSAAAFIASFKGPGDEGMLAMQQELTALRAEVERLEEDKQAIRYCNDTQAGVIDALRARVEKLRAALRSAYEVYAGSDGFIPETAAEGYQQQIIKQMVGIISAALGDTHE